MTASRKAPIGRVTIRARPRRASLRRTTRYAEIARYIRGLAAGGGARRRPAERGRAVRAVRGQPDDGAPGSDRAHRRGPGRAPPRPGHLRRRPAGAPSAGRVPVVHRGDGPPGPTAVLPAGVGGTGLAAAGGGDRPRPRPGRAGGPGGPGPARRRRPDRAGGRRPGGPPGRRARCRPRVRLAAHRARPVRRRPGPRGRHHHGAARPFQRGRASSTSPRERRCWSS